MRSAALGDQLASMAAPSVPGKWVQWRVTLSATLALLSCGMQFSWSSPAEEKIEAAQIYLTNDEFSWAVSLINIGALVGSILSGVAIDRIGRKWCIFSTSAPFIVGWILIYVGTSAPWLYAARMILGVAVGMSLNAVPIYVGEIASTELRGAMGTLCLVMMNMGVLFEYVVGPLPVLTYQHLAMVSCVAPILCGLCMLFVPESPVFLVATGREDAARSSMEKLRGGGYAGLDEELAAIKTDINDRKKAAMSWRQAVRSPGAGKALFIVSFLGLMMQMSGNAALLAYFQRINTEAGSELTMYIAYIIVSVLQVGTGLLSSSVVDKSGRRPLSLISCTLQIIAYALMGGFFYLKFHEGVTMGNLSWLPLALIAVILSSFNLGQGPLVYVLVGEILPQEVRAIGATSAALCISIGSFASTKVYPLVPQYSAFWMFAGLIFLVAIFFYVLVPETKGKSREEIRLLLAGKTGEANKASP